MESVIDRAHEDVCCVSVGTPQHLSSLALGLCLDGQSVRLSVLLSGHLLQILRQRQHVPLNRVWVLRRTSDLNLSLSLTWILSLSLLNFSLT